MTNAELLSDESMTMTDPSIAVSVETGISTEDEEMCRVAAALPDEPYPFDPVGRTAV